MRYFSGFSLKGEQTLFKDYIIDSEFCVAGFSYGAIKAFEYVYNNRQNRVDRLILLSPALFQYEKKSFIKAQLRYFKIDKNRYIQEFLKNVAYPSKIELLPYLDSGTYEELKYLLNYIWDSNRVLELIDRNITIEVFIGEKDKIINSSRSLEFFSKITTTYYLKEKSHILI